MRCPGVGGVPAGKQGTSGGQIQAQRHIGLMSHPWPSWQHSPAVPGRTRKSGSPETRRSPAHGCRVAPPGYGSAPGCRPQTMSRLPAEMDTSAFQRHGEGPTRYPARMPRPAPSAPALRTCLPPDGQVLLLLDVQHDLQATAHASCPAGQRALRICVEGITFSIAGIDLGVREGEWR